VLFTVQPWILISGLQFVELPARIVKSRTFKGAAATKIKQELDLEISEEKLINLTKLTISKKKVELRKITPKAMFLSARGYNKYI
jgi:hypothetical protein